MRKSIAIAVMLLFMMVSAGALCATQQTTAPKKASKTQTAKAPAKAQAAKTADTKADATKAQDVYTLKAPLGAVKFDHKKHSTNFKCTDCHHASKPEKANKTQYEACTDCHTNPPQAGMKTKLQAAFHNPTATAGTCVNCHNKEAAAGKKTPAKCTDCHKKSA